MKCKESICHPPPESEQERRLKLYNLHFEKLNLFVTIFYMNIIDQFNTFLIYLFIISVKYFQI